MRKVDHPKPQALHAVVPLSRDLNRPHGPCLALQTGCPFLIGKVTYSDSRMMPAMLDTCTSPAEYPVLCQ
jgi:hypothetical protein